MSRGNFNELKKTAFDYRLVVLDMVKNAGAGHIGGSMSCMDILTVLYHQQMNKGDKFILSKGHCAEALYAVLAGKGYFQPQLLDTFVQFDSPFAEHPTKNVPGVDFATGALGHGLSVGAGMALGLKHDKSQSKVYVLLGDGELAEGSNWEAIMSAAHYQLDNLIAIVDRNMLQISGGTEDVMKLDSLAEKFRAFNWDVHSCNGHDCAQLTVAFSHGNTTKPLVIIANTIKGYGSKVMENIAEWHHQIPTDEEYLQIKAELIERRDNIE